jgi:hypothetical protein
MSPAEFDETLRELKRAKPFIPFIVEMLDGRRILISDPKVSFDNGGAIYLTDSSLEIFECEDVRAIRPEPQGASA